MHLHIPRAEVSPERLAQILRGLRLETAVAGSQMTNASRENIFVKRRTHNRCQKQENVQLNPFPCFYFGFVASGSVPSMIGK